MGIEKAIAAQFKALSASTRAVATSSKEILAKNTLVVGDDVAVKTERTMGIRPHREGHVVWKTAQGALRNRFIIWPAAFGMTLVAPWTITPMLMTGATYLCYEFAHTVAENFHKKKDETEESPHETDAAAPAEPMSEEEQETAYKEFEKQKINTAVRTDFVMALETTSIALGELGKTPLLIRALSLGIAGVSLLAGVSTAVYGLLKIDDVGHALANKTGDSLFHKAQRKLGNGLLHTSPKLMKVLSVGGLGAMLLVGGNIIVEGIPMLHQLSHSAGHLAHGVPYAGGALSWAASAAVAAGVGTAVGFTTLAAKPYIGTAYSKTIKPIVNAVKGLGRKIGSVLKRKPSPDKGVKPDTTPEETVKPGTATAANAKPASEPITVKAPVNDTVDIDDSGIKTDIEPQKAMARAANPEVPAPVAAAEQQNDKPQITKPVSPKSASGKAPG